MIRAFESIFKLRWYSLQVSDWSEIDKLAHMKELETVYFEWNPIQTLCPADYLRKMKLTLPLLLQIDATLC